MGEVIQAPIAPQIAVFRETQKYALYAKYGVGKTRQAGHLIKAFGAANVGLVSCEDGLGTIETLLTPEAVFLVKGMADVDRAKAWAKTKYAGREKWVFVDGMSRVLQWIEQRELCGTDDMYDALVKAGDIGKVPVNLKPFARHLTKDGLLDVFSVNRRIKRDCTQEMDDWREVPCNVVFTFWEEETWGSGFPPKMGPPWHPEAPGKGAVDAIIKTCDWVFRLTRASNGPLVAHTDPAATLYVAKQRLDMDKGIVIEPEIKDFNIAEFHKRISGLS